MDWDRTPVQDSLSAATQTEETCNHGLINPLTVTKGSVCMGAFKLREGMEMASLIGEDLADVTVKENPVLRRRFVQLFPERIKRLEVTDCGVTIEALDMDGANYRIIVGVDTLKELTGLVDAYSKINRGNYSLTEPWVLVRHLP